MNNSPANQPKKLPKPRLKYALIVGKLEQAFSIGCTVSEACLYAGIHRDTYYAWVKNNPMLSDRFNTLKETPILQARQTVVKELKDNPDMAFRYLERKRKDEFSPKLELEHEAKKDSVFNVKIITESDGDNMEANKETKPDMEISK